MRRVIAHSSVIDELTDRLVSATAGLPIGNPMEDGTLVGPLIHRAAYEGMEKAIEQAASEGGKLVAGWRPGARGGRPRRLLRQARPSCASTEQTDVVARETFAPAALRASLRGLRGGHRAEQRGPAGAVLERVHLGPGEAERFVSAEGSDCGIVNVNIGTVRCRDRWRLRRREGDRRRPRVRVDAWRAYMRRATNTINYSGELPLAQGVNFTV
jgi:aldehyde dehydrogenase (NAD+)